MIARLLRLQSRLARFFGEYALPIRNARLHWLRFKRDTCNPMAPHFPDLVLRINALENAL